MYICVYVIRDAYTAEPIFIIVFWFEKWHDSSALYFYLKIISSF